MILLNGSSNEYVYEIVKSKFGIEIYLTCRGYFAFQFFIYFANDYQIIKLMIYFGVKYVEFISPLRSFEWFYLT